jgi:anaerobic ribonucleoside-triphosphate reductase activating protein
MPRQVSIADTLSIAQVITCTQAEGPGRRFAVWVQGCPLRCVGCCNPEFLPMRGGEEVRVEELADQLARSATEQDLEGLTLLGGEPFAQAAGCAELARAAHAFDLSVMVFSGYTLAELRRQAREDAGVRALLAATDILVDGPYDHTQPETKRRWIGSRNQQVHFLTDRCDPGDRRWEEPNTLELRLIDGELTVNGFPAAQAKPLWRRPPRVEGEPQTYQGDPQPTKASPRRQSGD